MTIVEMLIAIAIFVICMEGFTLLFVKSFKFNKFAYEEGVASATAQRATEDVVKNIRRARQADSGAYLVKSAGEFDFVFYCDYDEDGDTERLHYFLQNGSLKRGVANPSGSPITYPDNDQEVSTVTQYVVNTSGEPIFKYFNKDFPADLVANPLALPINPEDVRLVRVFLRINIDPGSAPENINVESFARLRNI